MAQSIGYQIVYSGRISYFLKRRNGKLGIRTQDFRFDEVVVCVAELMSYLNNQSGTRDFFNPKDGLRFVFTQMIAIDLSSVNNRGWIADPLL